MGYRRELQRKLAAPISGTKHRLLSLDQSGSGLRAARSQFQLPREDIMNTLPVDRALAIYGTIANRSERRGMREGLSRTRASVIRIA